MKEEEGLEREAQKNRVLAEMIAYRKHLNMEFARVFLEAGPVTQVIAANIKEYEK